MHPLGLFGVIDEGVEASSEFYKSWNEEVIRSVPEDRLLVFNVKQGWKPLCDFLGLPVPSKPFPNVNDSKNFQKVIRNIKVSGFLLIYCLPAIMASLLIFSSVYF